MSTALAVTHAVSRNPFEPDSIASATDLARTLAASALVPSALRNKPADIFVILATARELGIGPMQALSDINVIQGKPVYSADLMLSLCKRRPDVCKYIRLVESTDTRAVYETQRVGSPEPERFTFTMDDAKRLGLAGKDNYQKQARTMLRRRAAAMLARETYQDLVRGYDPDEAEEFKPSAVAAQAHVEILPAAEAKPLEVVTPPQVEDAPPPEEEAEAEEFDEVSAIKVRIRACTTRAQLLALVNDIKRIAAERIAEVRAVYAERQAELP